MSAEALRFGFRKDPACGNFSVMAEPTCAAGAASHEQTSQPARFRASALDFISFARYEWTWRRSREKSDWE